MSLAIENAVLVCNKLYFLIRGVRLLLVYDLVSGNMEVISVLPDGNLFDLVDGIKMYLWNDSIVFTPMGTNRIWMFNTISEKWSKIDIPINSSKGLDTQLFVSTMFEDMLFMAGCHTAYVIRTNIANGVTDYIVMSDNIRRECFPIFDRFRYEINNYHMIIPMLNNKNEIEIGLSDDNISYSMRSLKNQTQAAQEAIYTYGNKRVYHKRGYILTVYEEDDSTLNIGNSQYIIDWCNIKRIVHSYIRENHLSCPDIIIESKACNLEDYLHLI